MILFDFMSNSFYYLMCSVCEMDMERLARRHSGRGCRRASVFSAFSRRLEFLPRKNLKPVLREFCCFFRRKNGSLCDQSETLRTSLRLVTLRPIGAPRQRSESIRNGATAEGRKAGDAGDCGSRSPVPAVRIGIYFFLPIDTSPSISYFSIIVKTMEAVRGLIGTAPISLCFRRIL